MERCAVVLSGHSLRCGEPWGGLIDSTYYDGVFRANWMSIKRTTREKMASFVGSRVDVALELTDARCSRLQKSTNASCLSSTAAVRLIMACSDKPHELFVTPVFLEGADCLVPCRKEAFPV